ncbi:MAG: glycolate oxidase subunit GlcE [Pseudomonadota bacterium]
MTGRIKTVTNANLTPQSPDDVLAAVRWAAAEHTPLEIIGQGSKRALGRAMQTAHTLDLSQLTGVTLFEPEELVMTARAGTPLAEINALLDEHNQELQFEPMDTGPLLGRPGGQGTLGGLVNTNLSGPRRIKASSARDHVLGIAAVSGRGEVFKSGGRVVKNVTGYDLSKGVTGAWGTLAVLTDITMKVLPKAETEQTLVLTGLDDAAASAAMALAMGSNAEVSGAAHLPSGIEGSEAQTLLRLEGFEPSVAYRIENLSKMLGTHQNQARMTAKASREIWLTLRDCLPFATHINRALWRISCIPTQGHRIAAELRNKLGAEHFFDWQGGLIWLQLEGASSHAETVRQTLDAHGGGHAMLMRASADERMAVPVFQPQPGPLAALSQRYRENFDPHGILNPGRMVPQLVGA